MSTIPVPDGLLIGYRTNAYVASRLWLAGEASVGQARASVCEGRESVRNINDAALLHAATPFQRALCLICGFWDQGNDVLEGRSVQGWLPRADESLPSV